MGGATNPVTPAMCFAQPGAPHSQQAAHQRMYAPGNDTACAYHPSRSALMNRMRAHQRMYAPGTPPTNQMALHSQADT